MKFFKPQLDTSAAVNSVSNADGTLIISPTTGAVVASLNLSSNNIWKVPIQSHPIANGITYVGRFIIDNSDAIAPALWASDATNFAHGGNIGLFQMLNAGDSGNVVQIDNHGSGLSLKLTTDNSTTRLGITGGGKVSVYNGVTTTGQGTPAIYGTGRSTAQIAAVASVATYTVGAADGSFYISANVLVTASTTHSFTVTCTYTDEGNTSRTLTLSFSQLTGTFLTAITNVQGVGAYEGIPLHIRCKASTSITIATTGTFTSVTYNVEGSITQIA